LKFLLYLLLFYFAFKVLGRLFAPMLFKYATKKAEQKFGDVFKQQKQQQQQKEGEISIDKMPSNKSSNNKVGEYVDFEEIE